MGPHGGGPRGGGPRGGFHGGPRGFWGPRGFGGHRRHIRVVPPSYSGGLISSSEQAEYVDENGKPLSKNAAIRKKFGTIKGSIISLRLSTSGSMKEEMFKARVKTADDLFKDKRITAEETIKRKMDAAKIYYGYLMEIGYYSENDYNQEMKEFAGSVGGTYTPTTRGRTR